MVNRPLPKFLGVLATLIERVPTRAVCVVLPGGGDYASLLATLLAVQRLRRSIPARILKYADTEFALGQLVSVLPHGYVYEFGGVIPHTTGAHFKLRVLDRSDGLARSLPVREILRLQPTNRRNRKGRDNSELGQVAPTVLEQILNVHTSGNGAVVSTQVLLSSSATSFAAFAQNTTIATTSAGAQSVTISDVIPWASVSVDGSWRMQNSVDGYPLLAVSSSIERLRTASHSLERDTAVVVIDGARRVQNADHFHDIIEKQKTIVLAVAEESEFVRILARAGVTVWQPNPEEILAGEDQVTGPGSEMLRAAALSGRMTFMAPVLPSSVLDDAATSLRTAEANFNTEMEAASGDAVGQCFRLLLRLGEWYLDPTAELRTDARRRFDEIATRMRMVAHFLPSEVNVPLNSAMESIKSFLDAGRGSESKLHLLLELLSRGSSAAVFVRTPEGASQLREFISPRHPNATIMIGRGLPVGKRFDDLILAAWPGQSALQGILGRSSSASMTLIGHGYERSWFNSFVSRRRSAARNWKIEGKRRKELLGLPETEELAATLVDTDVGIAELMSATRLEAIGRPPRKGSQAESEHTSLETNYLGFYGSTYAHITPNHRLLRLVSASNGRGIQVDRPKVETLQLGDRILFRDATDSDILALIAEAMFPNYSELRRIASRWRTALKEMDRTPNATYRQLKRFGLDRGEPTVRSWLLDSSRIGPQTEKDLVIIADAAKDEELRRDASIIWQAVTEVRGAHQSAGTKLTDILLAELPASIDNMIEEEFRVQLSLGDLWVVQLEDIGPQLELQAANVVNRLLWDDRFL